MDGWNIYHSISVVYERDLLLELFDYQMKVIGVGGDVTGNHFLSVGHYFC